MQKGKSRTSEDLWRLWEDQEWRFKRAWETLQWEELCFQVPREVIWRRRPKIDENRRNWTQDAATMRLGDMWCALGMEKSCHAPWAYPRLHLVRLGHAPCAPSIWNARGAGVILCFLWVKLAFLAQTQLETLTINTILPHSEFLVQNCGSSIGRQLWSFRRVSIFSLIF